MTEPRTIVFTIPGKAVPKGRARKGRGGHWHTPQKTIDYEQTVAWNALTARQIDVQRTKKPWPLDARYHVELRVVPGSAHRQDVDNIAKSVLDGAIRTLWDDDARVEKLTVERAEQSRSPHVVMRVTVLEPERATVPA